MQPAEQSYNLSTHFDPTTLRDIPDDPAAMQEAVRDMEDWLTERHLYTTPQIITIMGRLGVYLRILGKLDDAQSYLETAAALSDEVADSKSALINRIRLAHVYQWQHRYDLADPIFQDCITLCETNPTLQHYLDFSYQHYGKSLFDQARYQEAASFFQAALDLRLQKGDMELIESTELALKTAQARMYEASR